MATAGLSFSEQFLGQPPDPFGPTPMASSGLGGLGTSTADMAVLGEALSRGSQFTPPQMRQAPTIAFSPSSNKVFVQGTVFDADDAAQALQSEQLLSAPGTGLPSAGDWVPLDAQAYGQYLESIRNPSLWRLAKKNFGRGVDVMQMLAGRGMQLAGAEQTGGRIVSAQMEDLRKTAPFERMFTDIESGRGAVEWFVANLAQQGPNLLESVATALAGFAAGSAVGTPLAGPGAALAALAGKSAFKQSVLAAAKKKAAGETLDAAENKLLREAAGLAGATAASYAQNLATGAADIYGELREQGAGSEDVSARMTALAGSIPYAALETLPEFVLAGRVLGNVRAPRAIAPGTSLPRRAGELLRRGAVGGAIGGTLEGTTEAGQEALLLGLSGQDLTSSEGMNRLINSFAAGFGVGGPIGAIANLRGNKPANLLESGKATEPPKGGPLAVIPPPPPAPPGTALAPYYTPVGPATPTVTPPAQIAGPPTVPLLAGPTPPVSPVGGPVMMVTPEGQAYPDQMLRQTGNVPPGAPGTQGVLDVFGGTISAQELATRMQPPAAGAPAVAPEAPVPQPGQGALQFAPAAPEAPTPTALGNALQRAIRRQQEAQMQQQREDELAAQREAELERLAGVAGRQRQLDLIEPERPALPMVPAEARPPRQLPLFPRGALPGPTRRQRAAAATPLAQVPAGARRLRRQRVQAPQEQLRLPYVATDVTPEIARATWNDRRPASVRKWEALSEEAQQKWTDAIIAAKATPALRAQISREETQARLKPKEKPSAAQEGKLKQGRVAERAQGDAGVGARGDAGQKPTAQVPAGGAQAGGRGVTLKRGKKAPVVDITQRRAEQIEEEDARREAEEDRAAREKIQAGLKERHTKRLQELMRAIRDGRKVLSETDYPGSLEAKELQRLLNGFQQYVDRFNELTSAAYAEQIQKTEADTFDRMMIDDLPRELESVKKLSTELTKPKKEPPGPKAEAARAAAPETAEERWAGMEDMPFTDLPTELQKRWRDAVAKGTATGELAAQLADDARAEAEAEVVAAADDLGEATRAVEETVSNQVTPEVRQALALIADYAFFTTEDTNTVAFVERARTWLGNTTLSEAQRRVLDEVVLAQVNERLKLEAVYTRGANKGTSKPWFSYATSRGMLFNIRSTLTGLPLDQARALVQAGKLKLSNLPADTQRKLGTVEAPATMGSTPAKTAESSTVYRSVHTPQSMLGDLIDSLISRVREMTNLNQKVRIRGVDYASLADAARTLYAQTTAEGRKYIVRGYPLSDYFTADGEPKIIKSAGRFIIGTKTLSAAEQAKIEKEQREEARILAQQRAEAALDPTKRTYDQYDSEDGAAFRDDGTPITKNVPPGRVRLLVTAFLSKLRRKPTVHIYANVEDLKKRNPELYRRAAASRSQGDFDTINAVGYSFGSPEAVPRISRRMFLRAAGAGISALKLPALSKETQLKALRSAWEMTFNTYYRWNQSIMTGAIGQALDNITFNAEGLYGYANNREVRDFLYRSEYADYAGDAYDYALVDLLEKEGPAALVDLQQAMQAQRAAMLDQLRQASSEKKATKDSYPGAHVLIFTDFVRTEQQLRFVLAHETIGHFGLRAVIPREQLDAALNRVFDADLDVQAAVESMMSVQGMSKLEAIEEYVADNAAILDSSLIMRLWSLLKDALNKLGLKFQDDEARYLINLSRKYVRRGEDGNFINATAVADDMRMMEQDRDDGRFSRLGHGDALERGFAVNAFNNRFGGSGGLLGAMDAFVKGAFGKRQDVPGTVARLLEQVQTLSNKARRSFGLSEIYRLLENQQQYARQLLSKYQRMTTLTHTPTVFGYGGGVTEEEKLQAGELLAHAALLKSKQATDEVIKSYDNLVFIDAMGNLDIDTKVRDAIEKAGTVTAEEFRKGFDIEYDDGKGNISKIRFQRDVDENSNVWKIYQEQRATVNEAAIDLMLANYEASQAEAKRVIGDLNTRRRGTNRFTQEDLATIRRVAETYQNMRLDGSDIASAAVSLKKAADRESEAFLVAFGRALFNDDVYAVWMKDPAAKPDIVADLAEFQKAEYDDIRAQLPSLRAKVKSDTQSFVVQKAIRDIFLFNLQAQNADYYAKRTILGSYVPFTRRGTEQVRLAAYDSRGNPVALSENVRAVLPYFQFDSRSEANAAAEELETTFGGDNEWVLLNDDGAEVTVRLRPEVSRVRQSPDLSEAVNFNEFVYVLNRLNINLTPQARERVITTLTNQNNRARKNLQRSGTPGWDQDVVRSVSEHLETSAHVSAKKLYRNRLDDILLNNSNWFGDEERLNALQQAVDNATTDGERARAQREYDRYAYMFQYMAASAGKKTVKIAGEDKPTLGRGEDYREYAKEVLRWYSSATNISDSTEDMLSGETGSRLKLVTVLMQLGGSVASAVLNLISIPTHSLPYLSFYNPKTGLGGGYGSVKSSTALWRALRDLKNPKLAEAADVQEILREGTWDQFGMTQDEAEFLFNQTEQGTLQAAQFNALVGTARGKVFSNKAQAAVKLWMGMFSYTEQLNRRATALAAYRLEKERALAQGIPEEQAIAEAIEAARTAVNTAQGEYAMFNRPAMARGNILQYLFVYKQFTILTVELLRSMPVQGQLMMLGLLLLMSGLKGLPFAEDLMDIVDTLAQMLGLKMASVEKELSTWIDAVAPGMTPFVMKGVLDRMTGATVSTRVGMGDLIPLTGAFRAGASPAQELQDFAGPVFGGISGLIGTAASLTQYGGEVLGLRDDTTSLNGILRNAPVAAVRAIADGFTYWSDGRVTNAKGQVVTADVGTLTVITRMMGFYPAIATEQNDIVRLSKYTAEYAKAIKADYVQAYVKARLDGNTERMAQIRADVVAWNESAKGTGLEIAQFVRSANRAANEAERPTVLRYLKSAPKSVRPETLEMLELNGIDPQELRQP